MFSSIYEPPHDKTNKIAYAPSEDSDEPGHPPSLIRAFAVGSMGSLEPSCLHADSEESDRTGRMPRMIWVFAGRTCRFVGFVTRRLILWNTFRYFEGPTPVLVTANKDLLVEVFVKKFKKFHARKVFSLLSTCILYKSDKYCFWWLKDYVTWPIYYGAHWYWLFYK